MRQSHHSHNSHNSHLSNNSLSRLRMFHNHNSRLTPDSHPIRHRGMGQDGLLGRRHN